MKICYKKFFGVHLIISSVSNAAKGKIGKLG